MHLLEFSILLILLGRC